MSSPQAVDVSPTLGVLQIGMDVGNVLFGILTLQVWNYFRISSGDSKFIVTLVISLYIAEALHTGFVAHAVYQYTITDFFNLAALDTSPWSLQTAPILGGLIICAVQCFYCRRIFFLTHSFPLASFCALLAVARLGMNLTSSISVIISPEASVLSSSLYRQSNTAMLCIGAATDVIIAASICIPLARMRPGVRRSDRLVDRLIAFTIGSGLLTSMCTVVEVILSLAIHNPTWLVFFPILGRLYSNSLLASLNERERNRHRLEEQDSSATTITERSMSLSIAFQKTGFDTAPVDRTHDAISDHGRTQLNIRNSESSN